MSGEIVVNEPVKEARLVATVHRCRCGHPESHKGPICPQAEHEQLGTVAYYHRNPLRLALWRVWHWIRTAARRG